MGLMDSLFGKSTQSSDFPWIALQNEAQIAELELESQTSLVVVFKHSTRCGISRSVLNRFERAHDHSLQGITFYYLDILAYRSISNALAARYEVWHESPQLLAIRNATVVSHSSHYDIEAANLQALILTR